MSSLFNSKGPQINYTPTGFKAGGLDVGPFGGVTPSDQRLASVAGVSGGYGSEADVLGGLRETVGPGFNDLLNSRLTSLNDTARSAIGDLRQNLASRRILGSSFGNDTISRAQTDFGRQRDAIISDNYLKSLAVNQQLAQQEFTARRGQFQTALTEMNFEATVGQKVSSDVNQILAMNAQAQAKLDSAAQTGAGSFLGTVAGAALKYGPSLFA